MKCLIILIFLASADLSKGATDDYNVEQIQSPFVSALDPGTHMTNRNTRSQGFQNLGDEFGPYSTSSKHEFHEEQRFVNGQPVYEKRHERRFQDGRLVHEDGHETGNAEIGSSLHGTGSSLHGTGSSLHGTGSSLHGTGSSVHGTATGTNYGSGYDRTGGSSTSYRSSSSRQNYETSGNAYGDGNTLEDGHGGSSYASNAANERISSGRYGGHDSNYGTDGASSGSSSRSSNSRVSLVNSHDNDDIEGNFNTDVERMRQRLHQGTSVIRQPVGGSSYHEENRQESRFVNGQQVYHKNQERRYENGQLVHDVSDETGENEIRGAGGNVDTGANLNNIGSHRRSGYESSVRQNQARTSSNYNPSSQTSYRASYWRPGPQARRVSTSSQRQTNRESSTQNLAAGRTPYQSAYETSTNRLRSDTNKPAYRASYTPSRSVERVPQISAGQSNSHVSSSSSSYPSGGHRTRPVISQPQSSSSNYHRSHSNKVSSGNIYSTPEQTYGSNLPSDRSSSSTVSTYQTGSGSAQSPHVRSGSQSNSTTTRRQFSTAYGSGSYLQPTESPATSQTTSRIRDTYSEPYSDRSSSYQPSRFANYSAWSHWKKDSNQASQPISHGSVSSQSRYGNSNTYRSHNTNDRSAYSPESNYAPSSSPASGQTRYPSENVRTLRPGLSYNNNDYDDENNEANNNEYGYSRSHSQYNQHSSSHSSSPHFPQTESSGTYTSNTPRTTDATIRAEGGKQVDLSLVVDVGEGDSVRIGSAGISGSQENMQERYDISPMVDGGVDLSAVDNTISSSSHSRSESTYQNQIDRNRNRPSTYGEPSFSSDNQYHGGYNTDYAQNAGSAYDRTTRVTNRTTNTLTSHMQPLISSYRMETRSSRRYLNGKLVSETKFNRYYENGALVHENQTERSRDEMLTDGVDVSSLDLTMDDLSKYGMLQSGMAPTAHSQRFELKQEREYVDGDQVSEATHERHYQDGELVHENHDEKDQNDLIAEGRDIHSGVGHFSGGGTYSSNFIENDNYGNNFETGSYEGRPRGGNSQNVGERETVTVSLSPRTRTHKTEIRQEQEFQDGEQVYDLRHERQYDDGHLVHEDLSEKGPEDLGIVGHQDALQAILSGRTLGTASQSGYRPNSVTTGQRSHSSRQYEENSYGVGGTVNTLDGESNSYDYSNTQDRAQNSNQDLYSTSRYQGATVEPLGSQRTHGQVGSNLLTSGSLTSVIGGGGAQPFDSLSNAPSLSTGSSSNSIGSSSVSSSDSRYDSGNSRPRGGTGGGYYAVVGGTGSGYGGARSQSGYGGSSSGYSSSSESRSSNSASEYGSDMESHGSGSVQHASGAGQHASGADQYGSGAEYAGYEASGSYGSYRGGHRRPVGEAVSHRREMEMEEHYENGRLVSGREEDKEWRNDNLLRHEHRRYGEDEERRRSGSSGSSSTYGGSGSSGQGSSSFGASASFDAHSTGHGGDIYGGTGDMYSSGVGGEGAITHRREMEMEEHYQNGQLVSGREEDKEWKNDDLLRHDRRLYGEGNDGSSSSSYGASGTAGTASALVGGGGSSSRFSSHSSSSSSSYSSGGGEGTGVCAGHQCRNDASCITGINGYVCICTFGFKGSRCQEAYCPTRYCRHDGICQVTVDGDDHNCSCPVGYRGDRCERRGTRGV